MKITNNLKSLFICLALTMSWTHVFAQTELPNGWKLSPGGEKYTLGDLPLQMITDPSGRYLIVANAGQSDHSLMVFDMELRKITDSVSVKATFYGLAFDISTNQLYSSGGNLNVIGRYQFGNGKLKYIDSIHLGESWPVRISPTGMYIDQKQRLLYVATKEDSSFYQISLSDFSKMNRWKLPSAGYAVAGDGGNYVFVSHWGDASVGVFNVAMNRWEPKILVGDNPNEMRYDARGKRLFVACSDDNSVHVIHLKKGNGVEKLLAGLYGSELTGSGTNALCLINKGSILLAANADNNTLAVFDVKTPGKYKLNGFIPTGWYPTQVSVVGNQIAVANGKGFGSLANPKGPNPVQKKTKTEYQKGQGTNLKVEYVDKVEYIGSLFRGGLQLVNIDQALNGSLLAENTTKVYANSPYAGAQGESQSIAHIPDENPIPNRLGDTSPVKYVFYIIKENRTYDQVLSDLPGGDGDTSLLLFGRDITPNQHKLSEEFVLLDHFYVDAEVSADGHMWSTAAYANDYTEKTWPTYYGGRGGEYVYEGQSAAAHPQKGYLWDHAKRKGVSFRSYGEFVDDYKPNIPVLENQHCTYFTSWDEGVKDSLRFHQWRRDFDSLLQINAVPALNTVRFINDHTEGVRKGKPTPFAHVADNDLAVGLFVDYLSKSAIWDKSVVFILEDDAQNGADHIDAHRSTAYLAGGFVKRGYVDHTKYSTSSMLRTMELILGMSPMSQYDAAAEPMWRCFSDSLIVKGFDYAPATVDLNELNGLTNPKTTSYLMRMSEDLDLSREDRANEQLMNEILWKYVKGENAQLPMPKRASWVLPLNNK